MANKPTKPTGGPSMGQYTFGWDGTDYQALNLDASGNLAALPIPTGAATSANQTNGTQKTQIVDGAGNVVGAATGNALDVNIKSGVTLEVNLDADDDEVTVYGSSDGGTTRQVLHTDVAGDLQIDVLSSALPTGAATEAKQDDTITALGSPAQAGEAAAAAAGLALDATLGSPAQAGEAAAATAGLALDATLGSPAQAGEAAAATASLALEAGNLATILSRLTTGGQTIVAIQDITIALNRMQAIYEIPITWAGVGTAQVDCGALLDAATKYEVVCVAFDADDDGASGATSVQLSIGRVTGFVANASKDELYASADLTFVGGVIGITSVYPAPRPFLSDPAGHVWLYVTTTGGTSDGSGSVFVRKTL